MNLSDIINNTNTYIGDSSTDRLSATERYQAVTEATAWLLEELGNEHMVDRAEIEYLPTVTWYKMDNLTPYLLTAGQLRFKEAEDHNDFTRVEARDLAGMAQNRNAYAIERFNEDAYLGITIPDSASYPHRDLIAFNSDDGLTYTGTNTDDLVEEADAVRFDMAASGPTATGLSTTTNSIDLTTFEDLGVFVFELEIEDMEDITSVSLKFGDDLSTDYWLGSATQDINGNTLVEGVNTIKIKWSDLSVVGTPSVSSITEWRILINHDTGKPLAYNFKLSDLRITTPVYLNFKYIFYRVGKNASGTDIIEFGADTDVPFFIARYPQYRYAVAHKAAGVLYRSLQLFDNARAEDREAVQALTRYRKNFSGERDMANSTFKVAGINFRGRKIIRRS